VQVRQVIAFGDARIQAMSTPGHTMESTCYDLNGQKGAAIQIRTKNPEALKAIYAFLRFQISDHQTGDTSGISRRP